MQLYIDIQDSKANAFIEFMKTLDYVKVNDPEDFVIPEEHKKIVRERIKNAKPEDYIPWEKAKKSLKCK